MRTVLLGVACLLLLAQGAAAQTNPNDPAPATTRALIVGTKEAPPFAMKGHDGEWEGISIELWNRIADSLSVTTTFQERPLDGLISGLTDASLDASVAALTVTSERERVVDFSHPFYNSGLAIAARAEGPGGLVGALRAFPWIAFLQALAGLAVVLFLAGFFLWLVERKKNAEQFGGRAGIGHGFWWSAVTMTTVGYGDKAPTTVPGRFIALIWMFASLFMISAFTAGMASTLTTAQLRTGIGGVDDLYTARVGTVRDSAAQANLRARNITARTYPDLPAMMDALAEGKLDAVVYDAPILLYLVAKRNDADLVVLPEQLDSQQYAIALPERSPIREDVNRAMLEVIGSEEWDAVLDKYLGQ